VEAELRRRIRADLTAARAERDGELDDAALANVIAHAIGQALGWHLESPEHTRNATLSSRNWRPSGGPRGGGQSRQDEGFERRPPSRRFEQDEPFERRPPPRRFEQDDAPYDRPPRRFEQDDDAYERRPPPNRGPRQGRPPGPRGGGGQRGGGGPRGGGPRGGGGGGFTRRPRSGPRPR
jgi:hypothetical protein